MKKRLKKRLIIAAAILLAAIGFIAAYVSDYYRADTAAIEAFSAGEALTHSAQGGQLVIAPQGTPRAGLIFYPGGKVEYTAYAPLMEACAQKGILCVLTRMPFNLAVLNVNAADGVQAMYPDIERWYIAGHSLGGSMAAAYLSEHTDAFDGLILLGAYSTADLSDTDLNVLSIYGSEDRVLSAEKYEANRRNLPAGFTEIVIDGGCHSYFGMYGAQEGDGVPAISNEQQILLTAEAIAALIGADTTL